MPEVYLSLVLDCPVDMRGTALAVVTERLGADGFTILSAVARSPRPAQPWDVPAEVKSDCESISFGFDAAPVLASFTDEQLVALKAAGWRNARIADDVAEAAALSYQEVADGLKAIQQLHDPLDTFEIGYEVQIDEAAALAWLRDRRPSLLKDSLATEKDAA